MQKPDNSRIKPKQAVAYSALTLAILVFIVQAGFGMIVNILKNIAIYAKLKTVTREYQAATRINKNLNNELTSFNSSKSLESIARNNLKMSGPDEILLIINVEDLDDENIAKKKSTKEKNISRRQKQ